MGRPRGEGDRYASGDLKPIPPHALTKRELIVGKDKASDPKAGYPLGILRLRGVLTFVDYQAAMKFVGLHAIVFGRGAVRSHLETLIYGLHGAGYDDAGAEEREARKRKLGDQLGEAIAVLHALPTRRPYDVLMNIGVHEREMRFMDTSRARTPGAWKADERDKDALLEATDALATLWKIEREAA